MARIPEGKNASQTKTETKKKGHHKVDIKKVVVGPVQTNCYLIVSRNEMVVVDPGDEAERIVQEIDSFGDTNHKYILLTHGHFDHVMAVNKLKEKYGFKVAVSEYDKDIHGLNSQIGVNVLEIEADVMLKDGQTLDFDGKKIKAIETPGHTMGGVCYLINDSLFSGDTLFQYSHGRTDLPGGSDEDMKNSLEKLLKLDKDIKVYPGHGPETTISKERG